jgi:hypothetical protein
LWKCTTNTSSTCAAGRHAFEEQHRQFRRKAKEGLETVLAAVDILLDSAHARENRLEKFYQQIEEQTLREAVMSCRHFKRLEERGYLDELCARYAALRRYLPTFFGLSFQAEIGSESLLAAIDLVRRLDLDELKVLPVDAPCDFVPTAWRTALKREDGSLERKIWEIALSLAVRDALRAGNLHLAESRKHVSFWPWSTLKTSGLTNVKRHTRRWQIPHPPFAGRRVGVEGNSGGR